MVRESPEVKDDEIPPLADGDRYLDHTDAAEYLQITEGTLRVKCSRREITYEKNHLGHNRYRQSELDEYIAQRQRRFPASVVTQNDP